MRLMTIFVLSATWISCSLLLWSADKPTPELTKEEFASQFNNLVHLPNLTEVEFSEYEFSNDDLAKIAQFPNVTTIALQSMTSLISQHCLN